MIQVNAYVAAVIIGFCFLFIPFFVLFTFYNKPKILKSCAIILFFVYLISISILVFAKLEFNGNLICITFEQSASWFSLLFRVGVVSNKRQLFLNLLMMFPISVFVLVITKKDKFCYKKTFILTLVLSFLLSACIEILQFVLPIDRTTEILDLVINTFSGALGFLFYAFFVWLFERAKKQQQN